MNPSGGFTLPNTTTCCIKDPTTDPNNVRFKKNANEQNYSHYELDMRPDNVYRYWIQGIRNPVPCDISQPYITASGKNDTIDYMASCNNPKYIGYNRNGRFVGSIFDP